MIPKIIHYCWFGRNPQPEIIIKCLKSWQKFLPDYEIILWNEDNYNVEKIPFTREAYQHKKFAFVSDYARFDILEQHGGIYLDTDVELLKSLDDFLYHRAFTGFEKYDLVAPGLILGAEPSHSVISWMKSYYEKEGGFHPERNMITVVYIMTEYLKKQGLIPNNTLQEVEGLTVYPQEYFAPLNFQNNSLEITPNTASIHHYAGTWLSSKAAAKVKIYQLLNKALGEKLFKFVRNLFK